MYITFISFLLPKPRKAMVFACCQRNRRDGCKGNRFIICTSCCAFFVTLIPFNRLGSYIIYKSVLSLMVYLFISGLSIPSNPYITGPAAIASLSLTVLIESFGETNLGSTGSVNSILSPFFHLRSTDANN